MGLETAQNERGHYEPDNETREEVPAAVPAEVVPTKDLVREFGPHVESEPTSWHCCQWETLPALGRRGGAGPVVGLHGGERPPVAFETRRLLLHTHPLLRFRTKAEEFRIPRLLLFHPRHGLVVPLACGTPVGELPTERTAVRSGGNGARAPAWPGGRATRASKRIS
jgi:hypothetical protein